MNTLLNLVNENQIRPSTVVAILIQRWKGYWLTSFRLLYGRLIYTNNFPELIGTITCLIKTTYVIKCVKPES